VYNHFDYDDRVVDTTFVRLFESEMTARFFLAKFLKAEKRYLDELVRELNLDFFTSRCNHINNTTSARVKTVSYSDENVGDDNENEMDLIG